MSLAEIRALPVEKKVDGYTAYVTNLISTGTVADHKKFCDMIVDEELPATAKTVLANWANELESLPTEPLFEISKYAVDKLAPKRDSGLENRQQSFLDADFKLRDLLAECYQADGDFKLAAFALSGAKRELSGVELSIRSVKIAQLYLGENATEYAWEHLKRASAFIHEVTDPAVTMCYRAAYAQIQDSQHKFLDAALRYYELAQKDLDDEDVVEALDKAAKCVVLAPAGPQRQRAMGLLYKDDRSGMLPSFAILEAMYKERFVAPAVAEVFEKTLLDHHLKKRPSDGLTLLEYALIEHNLLAASKLYHNISFEALGKLLGVSAERAEGIATKMILESRIEGVVDQIEGVLEFSREAEQLLTWDDQIENICLAVNATAEQIVRKFPVLSDE